MFDIGPTRTRKGLDVHSAHSAFFGVSHEISFGCQSKDDSGNAAAQKSLRTWSGIPPEERANTTAAIAMKQ